MNSLMSMRTIASALSNEELGQRLAQLGLADARRAGTGTEPLGRSGRSVRA
jgi:hypothetical protein